MMKLYNSLSRQVENFEPYDSNLVRVYTCGPTVYNFAHIGNLRSYIMEDVLIRTLKYNKYNVKRVMNITDVGHLSGDSDDGEDKMVKGAKRENKSILEIANFYKKAFFEDLKQLNILMPDVVENATDCITNFIEAIKILLDKGYAYQAGGNVYFDTSKLAKYHVFFNFKQEDLEVAVRDDVSQDNFKKNPNDFALWFTKSKFDNQALKWDSPWGVGYPGWHIECSCIAIKHLGEHVDIHCGGIDNAFPHHTNEIAQSEAILGHDWCKYWMHVLHLQTKDGKMSKSKGEFLTLSVAKQKGYNPLEYRFLCLQSHYRKQLVYSDEIMSNASNGYKKLKNRTLKLTKDGEFDEKSFNEYKSKFTEEINNDLNTAMGISVLFDMLKDKSLNDFTKRKLVEDFDQVLALDLLKEEEVSVPQFEDITAEEIEKLIEDRKQAKQNKNYALADQIRNQLASKGIKLIDTPSGTKYEKA